MKSVFFSLIFIFLSANIYSSSNLPVFTENKGQVVDANGKLRNDILYTSQCKNAKLYFQKNRVSLIFSIAKQSDNGEDSSTNTPVGFTKGYRMDLEFCGSNKNCIVKSEDYIDEYSNFYYSHCKVGITKVKNCKKIIYFEIYPNIDAVFYGMSDGSLKYDFIIKPGGNPEDIKYKYNGASSQNISDKGELIAENDIGKVVEKAPYSFQQTNVTGLQQTILTQYKIINDIIHLKVDSYDSTKNLVIDPWATYYGGNHLDVGLSITTDSTENVIFTGYAQSLDFPVSVGAFQSTLSNTVTTDAFLVKFDAEGNRLWATYFGGFYEDRGTGVCADRNGNIILAGRTRSSDLPIITVPFQSTISSSDFDCFLAKFNSAGVLLWNTYYGGMYTDEVNGVCCDRNDNIIIVGATSSLDFPVSAGAFQTTLDANTDGFVVKFDPSGNRLWGTYYGGTNPGFSIEEMATCVSTDSLNNIFFTGQALSGNFPVTSDAFQSTLAGATDSFIAKLDSLGNQLYSSYFGGAAGDYGFGIDVDHENNVVFSGYTFSNNFPVTSGAYQTSRSGSSDQFVVKFDNNCNRLWATYFGGSDYDHNHNGNSLAITKCNRISFTGNTYSTDFPVTGNATQSGLVGTENSFISQLDEDGIPVYSTYYGCGHHEYSSIAVGKNNSLYITGWTDSYCFSSTDSAFQETFGGGAYDAFVACDFYDTSRCIYPPVLPPCEATFFIPNVFTPNDDDNNDLFLIQTSCIEEYHLQIFNRWGESVFETSDANNSWNGKAKNSGQPSVDGIYYYLIQFLEIKGEHKVKKGFLMLSR